MVKETFNSSAILSETEKTINKLGELMSDVEDEKVNTVPYEGSWTAPQLLRHVTKSNKGITRAMQTPGNEVTRDPLEKVQLLRDIFLDFSKKFEQPEFIRPEDKLYEKQAAIDELNHSYNQYKDAAANANLNELVEGLPFGPVTKMELMYFVLYHTQRHLHQMQRICEALK